MKFQVRGTFDALNLLHLHRLNSCSVNLYYACIAIDTLEITVVVVARF